MTFQLTIETLLVFGTPGLLALISAMIASDGVRLRVESFFTTPDVALGIAIFVIVFLLGALLDTIRGALLDVAFGLWSRYQDRRRKRIWIGVTEHPPKLVELPSDYLSWLTPENLPVFSFLMERTHAYYRLSGNVFLATVVLAGLLAEEIVARGPLAWSLILLILGGLLHTAAKARHESFWAVSQFCKGEQRRCAADSRALEQK